MLISKKKYKYNKYFSTSRFTKYQNSKYKSLVREYFPTIPVVLHSIAHMLIITEQSRSVLFILLVESWSQDFMFQLKDATLSKM